MFEDVSAESGRVVEGHATCLAQVWRSAPRLPGGVRLSLFKHILAELASYTHMKYVSDPGIAKEKKRKYLGGSGGMLPWKILKVETKICAV